MLYQFCNCYLMLPWPAFGALYLVTSDNIGTSNFLPSGHIGVFTESVTKTFNLYLNLLMAFLFFFVSYSVCYCYVLGVKCLHRYVNILCHCEQYPLLSNEHVYWLMLILLGEQLKGKIANLRHMKRKLRLFLNFLHCLPTQRVGCELGVITLKKQKWMAWLAIT